MKKTVAILVAAVLVLSMAVNAVASGSQAIILGNAKFTAKNEEQVITIEAENLDSISVIQLILQYDSEKIELLNVVEDEENEKYRQVEGAAGALTGDATICRPEKGIITIVWDSTEPVSGSGVIANLSFKSLTDDAGLQKISVTTYDGDSSYVCRDNAFLIPVKIEGFEIVEAPSYVLGDVDGDGYVTSVDASYILQYAAEMEITINEEAADVDGDGFVTSVDASYVLQYAAEIITSFPVENNG